MKSILLIGSLAVSANTLANSLEIDLDAKHFANEVLSSNKLTNAQKLDLLLNNKSVEILPEKGGTAVYLECFLIQQTSSGAIGDNDIVVSDCAK